MADGEERRRRGEVLAVAGVAERGLAAGHTREQLGPFTDDDAARVAVRRAVPLQSPHTLLRRRVLSRRQVRVAAYHAYAPVRGALAVHGGVVADEVDAGARGLHGLARVAPDVLLLDSGLRRHVALVRQKLPVHSGGDDGPSQKAPEPSSAACLP